MAVITKQIETIAEALNAFQIELPSWGFANTGTRFGKFLQPGAATTIEEKFSDAGQVHRWTGVCPTVALHVLWDLPNGVGRRGEVQALAAKHGLRAGLDQSQRVSGPDLQVRLAGQSGSGRSASRRCDHILDSVEIAQRLGSRDLSLWFADGSNYPGHAEHPPSPPLVRGGIAGRARSDSAGDQRMLVEYKPFEPAFYHTDIADWGMALLLAQRRRAAGQGAGGYRPSLSGAEHRADRGVAARRGHARRLPLQRPPLCRRRSDHGLDRSLPGLPHLPRDPALRMGDRASAPTSPT